MTEVSNRFPKELLDEWNKVREPFLRLIAKRDGKPFEPDKPPCETCPYPSPGFVCYNLQTGSCLLAYRSKKRS